MSQLNWPLRSVMIPALSRLQDEPKQYRRVFLQTLAILSSIAMPIAAFLFVAADEIVDILLGSQWTPVVTTFRCLAPAAFLSTVSFAPDWLFISLGRTGTQFRFKMFSTPVLVIGFLVGVNWGINGVAVSYSITWTTIFMLSLIWACRKSPIGYYEIFTTLVLPALCSLLAACSTYLVDGFVLEYNVLIRFAICALVFTLSYFICVMSTAKGRELLGSMINVISTLRKKPEKSAIAD